MDSSLFAQPKKPVGMMKLKPIKHKFFADITPDDAYVFGTQYIPSVEDIAVGMLSLGTKTDETNKKMAKHNENVMRRARILTAAHNAGFKIPARVESAGGGGSKLPIVPPEIGPMPEIPIIIPPSIKITKSIKGWSNEQLYAYANDTSDNGYTAYLMAGGDPIDALDYVLEQIVEQRRSGTRTDTPVEVDPRSPGSSTPVDTPAEQPRPVTDENYEKHDTEQGGTPPDRTPDSSPDGTPPGTPPGTPKRKINTWTLWQKINKGVPGYREKYKNGGKKWIETHLANYGIPETADDYDLIRRELDRYNSASSSSSSSSKPPKLSSSSLEPPFIDEKEMDELLQLADDSKIPYGDRKQFYDAYTNSRRTLFKLYVKDGKTLKEAIELAINKSRGVAENFRVKQINTTEQKGESDETKEKPGGGGGGGGGDGKGKIVEEPIDEEEEDDKKPRPPFPPDEPKRRDRPEGEPDSEEDEDEPKEDKKKDEDDMHDHNHGYLRPYFQVGGQNILKLTEKEKLQEITDWDLYDYPLPVNENPDNPLWQQRQRMENFRFRRTFPNPVYRPIRVAPNTAQRAESMKRPMIGQHDRMPMYDPFRRDYTRQPSYRDRTTESEFEDYRRRAGIIYPDVAQLLPELDSRNISFVDFLNSTV